MFNQYRVNRVPHSPKVGVVDGDPMWEEDKRIRLLRNGEGKCMNLYAEPEGRNIAGWEEG